MQNGNNYKQKYLELRSKYMNDLDMAFRLGFEQGQQQAQQQQAMDAQAQAQEAETRMQEAQVQGQNPNGQPGEGKPPGVEAEGATAQPEPHSDPQAMGEEQRGSELDQHISQLEGMLGQKQDPQVQKSIQDILSLAKKEKGLLDMKKAERAISGIALALHKPGFQMGAKAQHNLDSNAKQALTLQHEIVSDVFKSWSEEENKADKDIKNVLKGIVESVNSAE